MSATFKQHSVAIHTFLPEEITNRLMFYFHRVLELMVGKRGECIGIQDVLSGKERKHLLEELNSKQSVLPSDKTIHKLFEEQVEKSPDSIALIINEQQLSYQELNTRANRLACVLRGKGVRADSFVGIMAERSLELMVGILAILKAGGAYVPIDPAYPEERVQYMLSDCDATLLLTQKRLAESIHVDCELLFLDGEMVYTGEGYNLEHVSEPGNLACALYTSGSTGKPKGVMLEHRGVMNALVVLQEQYPLKMGGRYLLKTTITFDVSLTELFGGFSRVERWLCLPMVLKKIRQQLQRRLSITVLRISISCHPCCEYS